MSFADVELKHAISSAVGSPQTQPGPFLPSVWPAGSCTLQAFDAPVAAAFFLHTGDPDTAFSGTKCAKHFKMVRRAAFQVAVQHTVG